MFRTRTASQPLVAYRPIASLLALLFLSTQLLGAAHMLVVAHAVCPAHGELIHGDAGAGAVAHAADHEAPPGYHSARGESGHAHEHCLFCALRREQPGLHGAPLALVVASAQALPGVPQLHVQPAAAAILLLAPKTSPPVPRV